MINHNYPSVPRGLNAMKSHMVSSLTDSISIYLGEAKAMSMPCPFRRGPDGLSSRVLQLVTGFLAIHRFMDLSWLWLLMYLLKSSPINVHCNMFLKKKNATSSAMTSESACSSKLPPSSSSSYLQGTNWIWIFILPLVRSLQSWFEGGLCWIPSVKWRALGLNLALKVH